MYFTLTYNSVRSETWTITIDRSIKVTDKEMSESCHIPLAMQEGTYNFPMKNSKDKHFDNFFPMFSKENLNPKSAELVVLHRIKKVP